MTDDFMVNFQAHIKSMAANPRHPMNKPAMHTKPKKVGKPKRVALYEEYDPQKHGVRGITIKGIDGKAMVQVGTTTIYAPKGLSDEELERREERKRRRNRGER